MAFNSNAYNFSNDLSRIGGALSKAMFGSAADDAAIARGKYYDAQTASTKQDTTQTGRQNTARNSLVAQPAFQNVIANAMGLDTLSPGFMGPPSSSQIRTGTPAAQNLAQTFLGTGGNAQQMANAANLFGEGGASRLAERMILGGSDKQAQRGALLKAPGGGEFQNPGFAAEKLRTEDATNRRDDDLDKQVDMDENRLRFGVGGQGDRDTTKQEATKRDVGMAGVNAEITFENYAADKRLEAANYKTNVDAGVTRDTERRKDATLRWKHNNRNIEIGIEAGKQIVVDPVTAEKLGIPIINDPSSPYNGLHVLDGGQKPGDVVVKVGREDVFMDETTAKAIGATKNDDGQYVIKGAGYEKDASTRGDGNTSFAVTSSDDTALKEMTVTADTDNVLASMSNGGFIQDLLVSGAITEMGPQKNISKGKNYIRRMLAQGFTEVVVPDTGTITSFGRDTRVQVPNFVLDKLRSKLIGDDKQEAFNSLEAEAKQQIRGRFASLGYSDAEVSAIIGAL